MRHTLITLLAATTLSLPVVAQTAAPDLTNGEVRKVDKSANKVTIRHGEIKHLDMPGMTMVFQATTPAELDAVKPGDSIRFKAERGTGGAFMATDIQPIGR